VGADNSDLILLVKHIGKLLQDKSPENVPVGMQVILSAPYKCVNCGAPLAINGSEIKCEYCGTEYQSKKPTGSTIISGNPDLV